MGRGDYLGEFEQLTLLAAGRLGDGAYGMTIRAEIEARTGRQVTIGAVYATVDRLVTKGYLKAMEPDPSAAGPHARRFFRLTRAGAQALERARTQQARMWAGLDLSRILRRS
jgi:PadR family transcriptional regulator, regulatory protein PadR